MDNFPWIQAVAASACFIGALLSWRSLMLWRVLLGILLIIGGIYLTLQVVPHFRQKPAATATAAITDGFVDARTHPHDGNGRK